MLESRADESSAAHGAEAGRGQNKVDRGGTPGAGYSDDMKNFGTRLWMALKVYKRSSNSILNKEPVELLKNGSEVMVLGFFW